MMALAGSRHLPGVLVPGGVTLPPADGEDAGKIQSIGARYAHGELTLLEEAAELGCRACGSPGGGCQFLGTAATSQVVAEALGLTRPACRACRPPASRSGATWPAGRRGRWSRWPCQGLTLGDILDRAARFATPWSSTRRSAARPT